jgi:hypothetical protein
MSEQALESISYVIVFRGSKVSFFWTPEPKRLVRELMDLQVKVPFRELSWLAENMSCTIRGKRIYAQSLDCYNRLIVYACVRPSLKHPDKAKHLALHVLGMNNIDAHYWASRFREIWWGSRSFRPLMKPVRAFKLFFNIE